MADADYRLLKTQKNQILILIQSASLDPREFEWEEREEAENFSHGEVTLHFHRLLHTPSGYAALFGENFLSYSPGPQGPNETERNIGWTGKYLAVERWLTYLKREIDAPDLWASLAQEQELFSAEPAGAVNAPFNADEQVQIRKAVEEIRVFISSTYSLAGEPLATVNRKLDYLIDASTRVGRIDWKNIFVGALLSLALQQLSPSGPGLRELFAAAGHLLRHVLGGVISTPLLH
ncbi:MAG: hypothetical protein WCH20_00455 [Nitrospira sp.]